MAVLNKIFILVILLQSGLAVTITTLLSKEGAYISMGIQCALIFLSLIISCMIFWTTKKKYLYFYIVTMLLRLVLIVFLFLDIFGYFHILESMDDLIIGKTAKLDYKNKKQSQLFKLPFFIFIGLMVTMILSVILSLFVSLKQNVKQTDEYGNVYRSSKMVSIMGPTTEKKTRFASQVITINDNNMDSMGGDPGITIIPNNNYMNGYSDNKKKSVNYNNYNMLPNDSPPSFGSRQDNNNNFDSMRRMKNETRFNEDYYSFISPEQDEKIKYSTLSHGVKPEPPRNALNRYDETNKNSTWDRSFAARRGHEDRERTDRARNRERIREREKERMRERNRRDRSERGDRERDRTRDRGDRRERDRERNDRNRNNRERDRNNNKHEEEEKEEEEKELHPGNISSREELETYLNKSSMSIYLNKSTLSEKNPKFVSIFEIEENDSDVESEDEFTMNHFTIKCKICKKDIPIEEVENHKCESDNIPLINVETEEHKQEMERLEKERKEKEEKERLEKEQKEREERERLEKERKEKEEKERLEREKEEEEKSKSERERRQRRQREREREREKSRERERDRDRRRGDERSRERRRGDERSRERRPSTRDRDRDRRRREKDAEWEQRYNNKGNDDRKHHERERERDQRRRRNEEREIREGGRYEVAIDYEQDLNDEVTVKVGNVFEVEKIYEDGWCVGTNLSTNKWGAIPLDCLNNKQERRRRIQSLYMC